jgi:hypothetical protein
MTRRNLLGYLIVFGITVADHALTHVERYLDHRERFASPKAKVVYATASGHARSWGTATATVIRDEGTVATLT